MQWVQNTTFSLGYIIVTRRSKAKENGVVSYVTLICDCGSEYKFKESSKKFGTKKTNCKFRLVGSYLKQYDGWTLRMICDQHNHPPAQHMEGHAYAKRLKENKKKLLGDLTTKNVTPRDVLSTLKEQDENNISTLKTIYNARKKLHSSQNVDKTPIQSIKSQHEWDSFRAMWTVLVESPAWILYIENYRKLQSMLSEYPGECIPLDSIDAFWKKLDLSTSISVENKDICCDGELEMFKENFTKKKLKDIFQLSKTLIKEPTIQKYMPLRRRNHSTMSKSVGLDLVELNKEPVRHSSYITEIPDLNQELSEQVSDFIDLNYMPESCGSHPLMKQIPDMFHPYITHVQDVRDQWLYVRHQLLDELLSSYYVYARVFTDGIDELRNSLCFSQSPAPAEHWMVMPMTGILIANRFGVILNYLTKRGDITFFPLWRGPEHFQYHHAITIAHVYDNHNVMVQLEGDYPMPTISAYWIRHRSLSTAGWQTMYMSRLEFYTQLKPCNLKTPVITIDDYC
ncbi:hypothetical protein PVK06_018426 [Gossypium arboreum]|uniref:Protein FAR1-RELATED SEQUENCE n=1 Tax=Gossypium arboreum TaxID=29729 RepID=A0ABR0Q677_GOSAR|nr:hypothetical protein PVK06_018426 [Gossypium arboreum]